MADQRLMPHACDLFQWVLAFTRNVAPPDREFTAAECVIAIEHYARGIDPWESASAICEGREPPLHTSNPGWWRKPMRPSNYAELSPQEQWEVDKRLGVLDDTK